MFRDSAELREYRIALAVPRARRARGKKGAKTRTTKTPTIDVRDIDSIQILTRALDLREGPPPRL